MSRAPSFVTATATAVAGCTTEKTGTSGTNNPEGDGVMMARVDRALAQLPPSLATELRTILNSGTRKRGFISPKNCDPDTKAIVAMSILDAYRACVDYDISIACITDMVTPAALDTIIRRVEDVIWEEINLYRVFLTLRKLYRYIHLRETPGPLRHRISYYARAARRDQWEHLRTPAEYITGAVAVAALADIMEAGGKELRARSRLRDATLLAVGAEINFRLQEFHAINVESIVWECDAAGGMASLFMAKQFRKNRKGLIGVVRDSRALDLLRRVIGSRTDGPLFRTNDGSRLTKPAIYTSLLRTSLLALGVPLTSNLLRRAGASDEDDEQDMARRIGDSSGGSRTSVAVTVYARSVALEGLALLRGD